MSIILPNLNHSFISPVPVPDPDPDPDLDFRVFHTPFTFAFVPDYTKDLLSVFSEQRTSITPII